MTPEQRTWLEGQVTKWYKVRCEKNGKGASQWLADTVADFIKAFDVCQSESAKLPLVSLPLHPHRLYGH